MCHRDWSLASRRRRTFTSSSLRDARRSSTSSKAVSFSTFAITSSATVSPSTSTPKAPLRAPVLAMAGLAGPGRSGRLRSAAWRKLRREAQPVGGESSAVAASARSEGRLRAPALRRRGCGGERPLSFTEGPAVSGRIGERARGDRERCRRMPSHRRVPAASCADGADHPTRSSAKRAGAMPPAGEEPKQAGLGARAGGGGGDRPKPIGCVEHCAWPVSVCVA